MASTGSRLFSAPDVADVLPFAAGRMYSAWDRPPSSQPAPAKSSVSPVKSNIRATKNRRTSMSVSNHSEDVLPGKFGSVSTSSGLLVPSGSGTVEEAREGWKDLPMPLSGTGRKRVWVGQDGQEVAGAYRVGWEKEVMDVEARLHEAMYDLAGERHSFIAVEEGKEPKTVLDIGTGLGLWPVSQALLWRETQFVGLDIVPCQLDLAALAKAESIARSSSTGTPAEEGLWAGVEKRITWDRANFLTTLPFDTGVFDMVHLRFLSLGIPESAWPALLDEALRVLAPGGHIEIVDMSLSLPSTAPASLHRSFASVLLAEIINPDPALPIQFAVPMLDGLGSGMSKPVFEAVGEGVLAEAAWTWVRSALEYKGTGIERAGGKDQGMVKRIKGALRGASGRWAWDGDGNEDEDETVRSIVAVDERQKGEEPKIWAWVGRKRS